jgi:hypothetical protein
MDRRDSSTRLAHDAELDYIIGLLDLSDEQVFLWDVRFVAVELDQLSKFGAEELKIGAVVDRQHKLDVTFGKLSAEVEQMQQALNADSSPSSANHEVFDSAMAAILKRIDAFRSSVNSRINHLKSTCTQLSVSVNSKANNIVVCDDTDKSLNIFGIAETTRYRVWKSQIGDVFEFVVGRDMDFEDAFRLGHFRTDKVRPILVNLRSVWDKLLTLKS